MKHLILSAALLSLFFASCKKDDPPQNYVVSGPYGNMNDVLKSAAPVATTASIIVSAGGSIRSQGGTRFVIPANAFVDAAGNAVTGSVDVTVNDWLKRGDMIFGKVLPVTATDPLVSGGQTFISVTQNNQALFLKPGTQITMNVPQFGAAPTGMDFFIGKRDEGTGIVTWRKDDSAQANRDRRVSGNKDTLGIFSDTLGLANADQFMSNLNYQDFNIKVIADSGTVTNVVVYSLYDQYKALWQAYHIVNGQFHEPHVPDIPVHFIAFGLINGYFYGGTLAATPKTGQTYTVTVSRTDPAAFKAMINAL